MAEIINSFSRINKELRYGVIYVVTSFERVCDDESNYIRRLPTKLMEWLGRLTGFQVEVVEMPEARGTTLVARRINVGNRGKDAVVQMPLTSDSLRDVQQFVKSATDVLSTDKGDKVLTPISNLPMTGSLYNEHLDLDDYCSEQSVKEDSEKDDAQVSKERSLISRLKFLIRKNSVNEENYTEVKKVIDKDTIHEDVINDKSVFIRDTYLDYFDEGADTSQLESLAEKVEKETKEEYEDEEKEILDIEKNKEAALQAIQAQILDYVTKYQADPSQLLQTLLEGKFIIGNQLSPLVINNDMKIVLPHYNEVEVKMPAMLRSIYILFLKHPEGIALRDIADYRADLENIYAVVMPGRNEEKAQATINNLVDPTSNTLNEYLSKIKRCFKSCIIDDELADKYCITGKRGEPYRINLNPALITLPRAVK
ncbi:MAG: hypothetical protein IJK68_01790 [Muribaculaceae bacterium]|nr:hypothetical protein [Muribaculaceae bacterium]